MLVSTLRLPARPVIPEPARGAAGTDQAVSGHRRVGLRASPRYAGAVFRRRSASAPDVLEEVPLAEDPADEVPVRAGITQAKGRPTPKRSEAERRRRQPYTAPADRKEASRQTRDRDRTDRARRQEAMKRGEEWALLPKDRGPVRKLARDYVDSRRGISQYYLFAVIAFFILAFIPAVKTSAAVGIIDYGLVALLVVCLGESLFVANRVATLARERFPGESTRGVKIYAAMRGAQLPRMRMPAPKVKPGDKI